MACTTRILPSPSISSARNTIPIFLPSPKRGTAEGREGAGGPGLSSSVMFFDSVHPALMDNGSRFHSASTSAKAAGFRYNRVRICNVEPERGRPKMKCIGRSESVVTSWFLTETTGTRHCARCLRPRRWRGSNAWRMSRRCGGAQPPGDITIFVLFLPFCVGIAKRCRSKASPRQNRSEIG
ncbi:hypothetical protein D3C84_421300 [compost metagenome]